jgi:2-methylcitrate dehydratase PrpD
MTIDALDIHDTCIEVKGHAGVALIPTALDTLGLSDGPVSGRELITTLVMAYDVAIRAGKALHGTACDYHTSGAWSALGCAAIVARRMGLSKQQTRHALGIAEYHGPRSQMMRCIDYPTMLKDGSGWGAMAGVSAGLMAADGFTGAPAITIEGHEAHGYWFDIGQNWELMNQLFKPYAVCYWAQAPIAGALAIQVAHGVAVEGIRAIQVRTFHNATRLAARNPKSTEEAQYSLPFPVAAALVHHRLGYGELSGEALSDPVVLALAQKVEMVEGEFFNTRFPAQRLAQVIVETHDGTTYDSGELCPRWGPGEPQPSDEELSLKFHGLARGIISENRAREIEETIWAVEDLPDVSILVDQFAPGMIRKPHESYRMRTS